jgi:hypothetical protein
MTNDTLQELLAVERAGWDALCDGSAVRFYGDAMTEDAVMVLANGAVLDRAAVVDSLASAPPWDRYALEDVRLVPVDADTSVLVYRGTAHRDGSPAFVAAMSSVYVRRSGSWRLALYQQTPAA